MKILKKVLIIFCILININIITAKANEIKRITEVEIGDYIDYSAGTWNKEEIAELIKEEGYELNKTNKTSFQNGETLDTFMFWGFEEGKSKDYIENLNYKNIKEKNYPENWRILSKEENSIKIISSSITELFTVDFDEESGLIADRILSGYVHPEEDSDVNATLEIIPRNWSVYENPKYAIENSAHLITLDEAVKITNDYQNTTNDLRNIGLPYFTSTIHCVQDMWTVEKEGKIDRWGESIFGVRPVVSIKNDIYVEKTGEFENHNIWKIVDEVENTTDEISPILEKNEEKNIKNTTNEENKKFEVKNKIIQNNMIEANNNQEKNNNIYLIVILMITIVIIAIVIISSFIIIRKNK